MTNNGNNLDNLLIGQLCTYMPLFNINNLFTRIGMTCIHIEGENNKEMIAYHLVVIFIVERGKTLLYREQKRVLQAVKLL